MDVEVVGCETVREGDGLAASSRNQYLSDAQRKRGLALSKALKEAEVLIGDGETDPAVVERAMVQVLEAHELTVDYAVVREAERLGAIDLINTEMEAVVCLIAAWVDGVRLIDNVVVGGEG